MVTILESSGSLEQIWFARGRLRVDLVDQEKRRSAAVPFVLEVKFSYGGNHDLTSYPSSALPFNRYPIAELTLRFHETNPCNHHPGHDYFARFHHETLASIVARLETDRGIKPRRAGLQELVALYKPERIPRRIDSRDNYFTPEGIGLLVFLHTCTPTTNPIVREYAVGGLFLMHSRVIAQWFSEILDDTSEQRYELTVDLADVTAKLTANQLDHWLLPEPVAAS